MSTIFWLSMFVIVRSIPASNRSQKWAPRYFHSPFFQHVAKVLFYHFLAPQGLLTEARKKCPVISIFCDHFLQTIQIFNFVRCLIQNDRRHQHSMGHMGPSFSLLAVGVCDFYWSCLTRESGDFIDNWKGFEQTNQQNYIAISNAL